MPTQGISFLLLQQRWVEVCSCSQGGWVDSELSFYDISRLHELALMLQPCMSPGFALEPELWDENPMSQLGRLSLNRLCATFLFLINKGKNQGFQGHRSPKFLFNILLTRWQVFACRETLLTCCTLLFCQAFGRNSRGEERILDANISVGPGCSCSWLTSRCECSNYGSAVGGCAWFCSKGGVLIK